MSRAARLRVFQQPANGKDTQSIWNRQVENFWEISWVKGEPDENDGRWLDHRKTWRSHRRPDEDEGGDHCTLMGEWQEISGYVRTRDSTKQNDFWDKFRNLEDWKGSKLLLDIVEGERLCAIALIKRLFPRLGKAPLEQAIGWDPCGEGGGNWPSTGHIATAHWIKRAHDKDVDACRSYGRHVRKTFHPIHFAEQATPIACLKSLRDAADQQDRDWVGLDANFYDENDLNNRRAMPLLDKSGNTIDKPEDPQHAQEREDVAARLKKLTDKVGVPAGYFALLRMDGDNVGQLLDKIGHDKVSAALKTFTEKVPDIVQSKNGVLVYAGGDDLFALFPIEDALEAAFELHNAYEEAFEELNLKDQPTISAGLVFADHHEPFRAVVEESRRLLEEVAKEKNGRDSIACSVLKPSGRAVEWVSSWTERDRPPLTEMVADIADRMRDDNPFSNRFIYNCTAPGFSDTRRRYAASKMVAAAAIHRRLVSAGLR